MQLVLILFAIWVKYQESNTFYQYQTAFHMKYLSRLYEIFFSSGLSSKHWILYLAKTIEYQVNWIAITWKPHILYLSIMYISLQQHAEQNHIIQYGCTARPCAYTFCIDQKYSFAAWFWMCIVYVCVARCSQLYNRDQHEQQLYQLASIIKLYSISAPNPEYSVHTKTDVR